MVNKRKLVSIKDVAKEAGVSLSTVSFALNNPDRVAENTRRHVLRTARELGYNRIKKHVKKGCLGIVTNDFHNLIFGEFYNLVVLGMLQALRERGVNVLVESAEKNPEYFPRMVVKGLVDGVLFLGKSNRDLIYVAQQKGIPVVLAGHPIPEVEIHTVVPDGRSGAFQAVEHLIELGHQKIALITGEPPYDPITADRVEGYRFALTRAGLLVRDDYLVEADFGRPVTALKAAEQLLNLSDPPTAFFCASDSLAYRAYQAIKSRGLKIPQDISVVGFDDISAPGYAELPKPELTTIRVDRQALGRQCVETLFDIIQNPSKTVYRYSLPVKLVVKKSTAKPIVP
jgi:DNA-binding LacI/PurR family transcriptional regulator